MDLATASREARKILTEQGYPNWGVLFEDNPKFLGVCRYQQRRITLLVDYVLKAGSFGDIMGVVLHEVAHAMCPGDEHGKEFHKTLRKLIAFYVFGNS